MDTREFDVNGYHLVLKRNIGPGPYLFTTPDGREVKAASGEYLLMEDDKPVTFLPARLVDAMGKETDEVHTIERTRMLDDNREVSEFFEVETGPGERFDGVKVLDKDNNPVEEKSLSEARVRIMPSSQDFKADGEIKEKEDIEKDIRDLELAIAHPANKFNEAAGRAVREAYELAKLRLQDWDQRREQMREATDEERENNADPGRRERQRRLGTSPDHVAEGSDERLNRLRTMEATREQSGQGEAERRVEEKEKTDEFGFPLDKVPPADVQTAQIDVGTGNVAGEKKSKEEMVGRPGGPKESPQSATGVQKGQPDSALTPGQKGTIENQQTNLGVGPNRDNPPPERK